MRLLWAFLMAGALVMGGCTAPQKCKPNPEWLRGCIPADCESCGPVGPEHYRRST